MLDLVGGPSLARSRKAAKPSGVVVSYGFSFAVDSGHSRAAGLFRTVTALARAKLLPGPRVVLYTVGSAADKDPVALREDLGRLIALLAAGDLHPPPTLAVPHHYAFHSGWLGDRMITKGDQDPRHFADAVARLAPEVAVRLVLSGTPVVVV